MALLRCTTGSSQGRAVASRTRRAPVSRVSVGVRVRVRVIIRVIVRVMARVRVE